VLESAVTPVAGLESLKSMAASTVRRRIEQETRVRRERTGGYLKALATATTTIGVCWPDVTVEFCTRGTERDTGTRGAGKWPEEIHAGADHRDSASGRGGREQRPEHSASLPGGGYR
jgi:hypothetical protein